MLKPDEKVLCIRMYERYSDKLTIGCEYTIGEIEVGSLDNIEGEFYTVKENNECNTYGETCFISLKICPERVKKYIKVLFDD